MGDRSARAAGYLVGGIVGLGIGGILGFTAFAKSLCNTWGEQCSPEEYAEMERLWGLALSAPVAAVGAYALVDLSVHAWRRREGRSGQGGN